MRNVNKASHAAANARWYAKLSSERKTQIRKRGYQTYLALVSQKSLAEQNRIKDAGRARLRKSRAANPERTKNQRKKYYLLRHEQMLEWRRAYYRKNIDRERRKIRAYYRTHKQYFKDYNRVNRKRRYVTDDIYRLSVRYRSRIVVALKRKNIKRVGKIKLLGCTVEELKRYLESLFKPGMTWANHGVFGWHIDHRRPCASFDLSDPNQQEECFHFSNLQPLWWTENLNKGATWPISKS